MTCLSVTLVTLPDKAALTPSEDMLGEVMTTPVLPAPNLTSMVGVPSHGQISVSEEVPPEVVEVLLSPDEPPEAMYLHTALT